MRRIPPEEVYQGKTDGESMRVELPALEDIDGAVLEWIKGKNLHVENSAMNDGFQPVPVMWVGTERAYQTKLFEDLRDESGSLMLPVITVGRGKDINKDPANKGQHWSNIPAVNDFMGGVLPVGSKIVHDKTAQFQNNHANRVVGQMNYRFPEDEQSNAIVRRYDMVPIPVYVTISYSINIWTSFQQHLNQLQTPFLTQKSSGNIGRFVIGYNEHNFEAWIQPIMTSSGNEDKMEDQERQLKTEIQLKVLGHIAGEGANQKEPIRVHREGYAKVVVGMEEVVEEF